MKSIKSNDIVIFNSVGYLSIFIMAVLCLIPFLLIISGSITQERSIIVDGYKLLPDKLSLEAYKTIFQNPQSVLRTYGITIFITLTGTALGLSL